MNDEVHSILQGLERRVAARTRALETSAQVSRRLSTLSDPQSLITAVSEQVRDAFNYYHVQIFLLDDKRENAVLVGGTGEAAQAMLARQHKLPIGKGVVGRAAATNSEMLVPDVDQESTWLPNPLLPDTRGELAVPIAVGDLVIGVLDVQHVEPGGLSEADAALVRSIADQVAVALQNARLYEQAQQRADQLATLNRITETVASVLDLKEALSTVARELVVLFGARNSGITMVNEARDKIVVVADYSASPNDPSAVGLEIPIPGNLSTEYVIKHRRSVLILEPKIDPLTAPIHEMMRERNTECLMIVPLLARGETIGTIGVDTDKPNRKFTQAELNLAETVAGQIAGAIENARLYTAAQQEIVERKRVATELETVAEVSTTVSTVLAVDKLLQDVVDLARERFGLYHAHIYLLDEHSANLVLAAGAGEVGRTLVAAGHRIAVDQEQSLVARAARTRQGVIANDVRLAPDFLPNPLLPETRSEMAVPMIAGNQLIGVFDVQAERINRFTEADIRTKTTLAAQVAVALQNAKLYAEQAATVVRLRELDQLKSTFLANMSHELRTPLNSIIGFTEVIMAGIDGEISEDAREDLQIIHDNGSHLLGLINDILDMAKIESGRMELHREPFGLAELLHETVNMTTALAEKKGLYLKLETAPKVLVDGDRQRIRQVLLNLISNGLKFTERGGVTVWATLLPERDEVMINVRDSGVGVRPEDMALIFEEFRQADNATTRKAGGTGLGLPISRHLIEMHGGQLWGESTGLHGDGAVFKFTLALAGTAPKVVEPLASQQVEG